jgi:hypothetical protein
VLVRRPLCGALTAACGGVGFEVVFNAGIRG